MCLENINFFINAKLLGWLYLPLWQRDWGLFAIMLLLTWSVGLVPYERALGGWKIALRVWLGSYILAFATTFTVNHSVAPRLTLMSGLFWYFSIPFIVGLYWQIRRGPNKTPNDRKGWSAQLTWLRGWNFFWLIGMVFCAWLGLLLSIWALLLLIGGIILGTSLLLNMGELSSQTTTSQHDELAAERDRVLRLLEEKRITAEECAELLSALGESRRPLPVLPAGAPTSASRKLLIAGVALVLVGFLLPWFDIDARQFMDAMQQQLKTLPLLNNQLMDTIQQQFNAMPGWNNGMPGPHFDMLPPLRIVLNGADIARGYGWVILLAGLIAAVLPFFASRLPDTARRWPMLLSLFVGSAMLLYLLVQNINFVSYGLVLVIVGYGLEYAGVLRERGSTGVSPVI